MNYFERKQKGEIFYKGILTERERDINSLDDPLERFLVLKKRSGQELYCEITQLCSLHGPCS